MGLFTRAVVFRWLARWLTRGSPLTIIAKIAAVGAFSAWRYHRQRKRLEGSDQRRIDAEYEVLGPERIAPVARPQGEPSDAPKGTRASEVHEGPRTSRSIHSKEGKS